MRVFRCGVAGFWVSDAYATGGFACETGRRGRCGVQGSERRVADGYGDDDGDDDGDGTGVAAGTVRRAATGTIRAWRRERRDARQWGRVFGGAARGGTNGYVTGGWERRGGRSQRRVYCREVAWRGKETSSHAPSSIYGVCVRAPHTDSHSPGLAPGPTLRTFLAAHRATQAPRGSTE